MWELRDPNPKRTHHSKKLKVEDVMRKLNLVQKNLKRVKNSKKTDSHGRKLNPFPRNASNPYYWEKSKKNKAVREILKVKAARVAKGGEKKGGKKQNGGRKFERLTPSFEKQVPMTTFSPRRWPKQRVAVESDSEFEFGKNFEFKLLKPLAAAFDDVLAESDAEFHSWSDEPQRRSSEEAAARRQEDEEIWRLKQESRLMSLSEEAAVRRQEDKEILGLKREAVVRRREDEISVHKATLRRARLGTARNRLDFDDVDFCWPSPPRGRLVWDED
jgi:hypothetical protein